MFRHELYTQPGMEAGYVISGKLELAVEAEVFILESGDSFNFKSTLPHRLENGADVKSEVLWSIAAPACVQRRVDAIDHTRRLLSAAPRAGCPAAR